MFSMKLLDKNNDNNKKTLMNVTNDTLFSLVQLSPNQPLKGTLIDRIREMNKNAELNKNCSSC
jgi:hypothetical protein